MASSKTTNYSLSQWKRNDPVSRTDFNRDNQKLDSALQALNDRITDATTILTGSYTGDGSKTRTISLPFNPRLLIVQCATHPPYSSNSTESSLYGGTTAPGQPCVWADGAYLELVDKGFQVYHGASANSTRIYYYMNIAGTEYYYIAFR